MEINICQAKQSRYLFDAQAIVVALNDEIYCAFISIAVDPRCSTKLSHQLTVLVLPRPLHVIYSRDLSFCYHFVEYGIPIYEHCSLVNIDVGSDW
jgi:hypothetical protein